MFQSSEREPVQQQSTTISEHMNITGTLASDGNVVFDGKLEKGTIRIGGHLMVGAKAHIKGEVEAQRIVVNGQIDGTVIVQEDLEIGAGGKINGDVVVHGKIVITKGGIFNGKCTMGPITEEPEPVEVPTPSRRVARDKREVA